METKRFTPDNITSLKKNEIFVFGSNLKGQHGGGAARAAWEKFGAVWGNGAGFQGKCYAIPTMFETADEIKPYVDEFYNAVVSNKDKVFLVTKIGLGIAGFTIDEIAPLFYDFKNLPNVYLPKEFFDFYENNC